VISRDCGNSSALARDRGFFFLHEYGQLWSERLNPPIGPRNESTLMQRMKQRF